MNKKVTPTTAMFAKAECEARMLMEFGDVLGKLLLGTSPNNISSEENEFRKKLLQALSEQMAEDISIAAAKEAKIDKEERK